MFRGNYKLSTINVSNSKAETIIQQKDREKTSKKAIECTFLLITVEIIKILKQMKDFVLSRFFNIQFLL